MLERFTLTPDQRDFAKRKRENPFSNIFNKIKPPKGNPKHIRPPQIENPVQKPHRQPNNRNNRRK